MANDCLNSRPNGAGWQLLAVILLILWLPLTGTADVIHLKDGQRLTSPRAWVDGNYVHFILEGTTAVEIRYAIEIVDRILTSDGTQIYPQLAASGAPLPGPLPTTSSDITQQPPPSPTIDPATAPTIAIPQAVQEPAPSVDTRLLRSKAKKLREVPFYDPRRPKKYWASPQSRHDDVSGAVDALAEMFAQTPQWVTAHMGNTNNLSQIHVNLIRQVERLNQRQSATSAPPSGAGSQPVPPSTAAAARKVPKTPPNTPPRPGSNKSVRASNPFAGNLPDTSGPFFYSPRRPQKFWANEASRHDSLDGALNALADQYGQSIQWIERHMGESNSLPEIHRNLTQAAEMQKE